jgi:hypothetical protein
MNNESNFVEDIREICLISDNQAAILTGLIVTIQPFPFACLCLAIADSYKEKAQENELLASLINSHKKDLLLVIVTNTICFAVIAMSVVELAGGCNIFPSICGNPYILPAVFLTLALCCMISSNILLAKSALSFKRSADDLIPTELIELDDRSQNVAR